MKKILSMKRIVSIVVMVIVTLNLCTTAYAATSNISLVTVETSEDILAACGDAYYALDSEAKAIFDASLMNNPKLLKFHITYVDKNFVAKSSIVQVDSLTVASADTLTLLMNDLSTLGLATEVLYSLQAMGAGMVAAIADGPLPIGDILLLAATASAAIILAANWDTVYPVFDEIVSAFKKAFSAYADNIISAFSSIKSDTATEVVNSRPQAGVSGKVLTLNGVQYLCNTRADQLTQQQKNNSKYYPAVLYSGYVWVDTAHSADGMARVIMMANNPYAGVWATTQSYARGLCGGSYAIWHNSHNSGEGYFYHYHHPAFSNFHCWYL